MGEILIHFLVILFYVVPCILTLILVSVILQEELKNLKNNEDYKSDFILIFLIFIFAFIPVGNLSIVYYFVKDFFDNK